MNDINLRIGHFSPDAPNVNVIVDGDAVLEDVAFSEISDFMSLSAGSYDVEIVPVGGDDAVISATLDLEADTYYTVLAIGRVDAIDTLVLTDEFETMELEGDESSLRFVHCSPDAPAVDLRLVDGTVLFEGIEFGDVAEFLTVDAERYDVEVIPSGTDDVVLSLSDLTLEGGIFYTAIAMGILGDDSLDATLIEDFRAESVRRGRTAATR